MHTQEFIRLQIAEKERRQAEQRMKKEQEEREEEARLAAERTRLQREHQWEAERQQRKEVRGHEGSLVTRRESNTDCAMYTSLPSDCCLLYRRRRPPDELSCNSG